MEKNHKHFILNAIVKNPIDSEDICKKWLMELVDVVDMDVLIPAVAKYCDIPGNEGVTGTVVITTSHASIHVWPQAPNPYIRMDVYSCKDFDTKAILRHVDDRMTLVKGSFVVLDRNPELLLNTFSESMQFDYTNKQQ